MNKNKLSIFRSLSIPLLLILIVSLYFFDVNKEADNKVDISLGWDETLLKIAYYEGREYSLFNSAGMYKEDVNLYYLYWVLNIMDMTKVEEDLFLRIKNEIFPKIQEDPTFSKVENIKMLTRIREKLGIEYDKNEVIKQINVFFDTNDGLYFKKNASEHIFDKLAATSDVEELYRIMGISDPNRTKILQKLTKLYNEDSYFKEDDVFNQVSGIGTMVIHILYVMDQKKKDIPDLKDRKEWLIFLNNDIEKKYSTDWMSVLSLNSLYELNSFFELDYKPSKEVINKLLDRTNLLYTSGSMDNIFTKQPLILYYLIKISEKNQIEYSAKNDLYQFIVKQIETEFKQISEPKIDFEDNYYGIVAAKYFKFPFDESKMIALLRKAFTSWLIETPNIDDSNKLRSVYYLLESYNELELEIMNKNRIITSINTFINKLDLEKIELIRENAENIVYSLKILQLCEGKLDKENSIKVLKFINLVERHFESTYTDFKAINIYSILLDLDIDNPRLTSKLDALLKDLNYDGGFKPKIGENGVATLNATFQITNFLNEYKLLTSNEKSSLISFLSNNGSQMENKVDLRKLYETIEIHSISQ